MKKLTPSSYKIALILFGLLLSFSALTEGPEPVPTPTAPEKSAYEIWSDINEGILTQTDKPATVKGVDHVGNMFTFGGEKEGSSSLITRVMGPDKSSFKSFVESLPSDKKTTFLRTFLSDFSSGRIRIKNVLDKDGNPVPFDLSELRGVNYSQLDEAQLLQKLDIYLEQGGDKHLSHVSKGTRQKIFNGKYGGLSVDNKRFNGSYYGSFVPLHGKAEKFISAAHGTSVGWEMNFKPQGSYGEFEHMIEWFRDELKNRGKRFEAPGHQWVVYPKTKEMLENTATHSKVLDKVGEIHKNSQAYIVLKSIEGNAGIELSSYKSVQPDNNLLGHSTGRGVIRVVNNDYRMKIKENGSTLAIEYRAGTKNNKNRRKTQKFLISRYAAQEFDDLADGASYTLYRGSHSASDIARRFGVGEIEAQKFLKVINGVQDTKTSFSGRTKTRHIKQSFLVPLWNWEDVPYLKQSKKDDLRKMTTSFIRSVAHQENPTVDSVRQAIRDWTKVSRLSHDVENYLTPKQKFTNLDDAHVFKLPEGAAIDVNKVDMGIEYSARFPLKTSAEFVEVPNQVKKFEWQKTFYEYTPEERSEIIKNFAARLGQELNGGTPVAVTKIAADGHGHGLDIAYEVKDKEGRTWRAEWDGIGRNYDLNSEMIPDSVRGGHIEIVTPKFTPSGEDMKNVFAAMDKENLIPMSRFGGGHINIDLKPFEGKPKKMARFLGTYLDHRNVMSMMFQHPGRQIGAEPFKVSQQTIQKLKNFNGSEEDLKKLLYNERFFNTRVGRKTKNSQLNLTAYFQDIIPEKYLHEDFDMKNDMWRRTFDVEPKIRKMEFRMFNAPRNQAEAALQIKFTKALLNKALNESDEVFTTAGKVDYEGLLRNPEKAFLEFEKTMDKLGLDKNEYKGLFLEGMLNTKDMVDSPHYVPVSQRLTMHPEIRNWDAPVDAREVPIGSEGRKWSGNDPLPEAIAYKQQQMMARQAAERGRDYVSTNNRITRAFDIDVPYELTLNLDQIKNLESPSQQLSALYYQQKKMGTDPGYKTILNDAIKKASRNGTLTQFAEYYDNYSNGYLKFIGDNLPTGDASTAYDEFYKKLISHPDTELKIKAKNHFLSSANGQQALFDEAIKNLVSYSGDREKGYELLKYFDQVDKSNLKVNDFSYARRYAGGIGDKKVKSNTLRLLRMMSANSPESYNNFLINMVSKGEPESAKFAFEKLKKSDPLKFELLSDDFIKRADIDQKIKNQVFKLKDPDFYQKLKVSQFKNLGDRDLLNVMHKTYLAGDEAKKAQVLRHFHNINDLDFATNTLYSFTENKLDRAAKKWFADNVFENKAFAQLLVKEEPKEISKYANVASRQFNKLKSLFGIGENTDLDAKALEQKRVDKINARKQERVKNILNNIQQSKDKKLRALALDFYDKLPESEFKRNTLTWEMLTSPGGDEGVKKELFARIRNNPELMPKVKDMPYESFVSDYLSKMKMQMVDNPNMTTDIAHFIAKHPDVKFTTQDWPLMEMMNVEAETPKAKRERRIGYYLMGLKNSNYTHAELPKKIGANQGDTRKVERDILKAGKKKQTDFIQNLTKADLQNLNTYDKISMLEKRYQLKGDMRLASVLDEPAEDLLKALVTFNSEHSQQRKDFVAKLLAKDRFKHLLDVEKLSESGKNSLEVILRNSLLADNIETRDMARVLMKKSGLSLPDLIESKHIQSRGFLYNSEAVVRTFKENPLSEADLLRLNKNSNFTDLLSTMLISPYSELDFKAKNELAKVAKQLPGNNMSILIAKELHDLNGTDIKPNNPHVNYVLKGKKNRFALDTVEYISKYSDNPNVKKSAKKSLEKFYKDLPNQLRRFDNLSLDEQIGVLFRQKSQNPSFDFRTYLDRLKGTPDEITRSLTLNTADILAKKSKQPSKYKKFLAQVVSDPVNARRMGLQKKHIIDIAESVKSWRLEASSATAMVTGKIENEKLTLKILESSDKLTRKEKLTFIHTKMEPTETTIDALKVYATRTTNHPVFADFVKQPLVINPDQLKSYPKRGARAAELMLMLPKGDIEAIVKDAERASYYSTDKAKEYLVVGMAKHKDSPIVNRYARTLASSDNARVQRIVGEITTSWDNQSGVQRATNRIRCSGRTIRQLLNRLTFR